MNAAAPIRGAAAIFSPKGVRDMFDWIRDNLLTIGILLVLAAAVFAIVFSLIRDRKKGRSSCGSGCAHCPMAGKCRSSAEVGK